MAEQVQVALSPTTLAIMAHYWNNIDNVMQAWKDASETLDKAKQVEMDLRRAVFEVKFPGHGEGTTRVPLANGYHLKAVGKMNYNLANKEGETEGALTKLAAAGPEGAFIADRLVKWTPELSITEYRKLAPHYKTIIDTVLTIKPGAPTLEIEAPKTQ